jgi:hypothetical protein
MRIPGIKSVSVSPSLVSFLLCLLLATGYLASASRAKIPQEGKNGQENIQIPPPPLTEGIFPCSQCHAEMETNFTRRKLEDFHDDIVFQHDQENRWCLDCHDAENRDMLHTASGELISFEESYKLCGQCHGPKLRDWKAGIHGRRTGYWNGSKKYLLCVHCHNPHSPKFPKIEPEPAPRKPGKIK